MSAYKYSSIFSRQIKAIVYLSFTTKYSPILIGLNLSRNAIVFVRGETYQPIVPGWILLVRENFSVNKRVCRK